MEIPNDLHYTIEHEWVRMKNNRATIGITDFAQGQLGDVVFVELPAEGTELTKGSPFGVVESVKTVSDIYAPVTAKVVKVNKDLESQPELVNSDPYGQGWMIEIEFLNSNPEQNLLSAAQYIEQCKDQE
ncbi:MAG: glycine cleavage system protein GcvH [Nitrospinaceae bacterium]|jgi:glycine cleavage system H protein|nr:glycine cleavage system protein GcvH [Nitrospina sp.]MBT4260470.1 glycine cleavage system protein GcvH [Nitrospina sp.]MBT5258356.1 glycine cleavage system protein GcvH [Nitrospina sp.]MBT5968965.1 glycine cleavage system protein GcvH [Nitrospina sp.]MDG1843514.1 glycine cleavage system protein GcvH [Nitrospinaceae bacterium]